MLIKSVYQHDMSSHTFLLSTAFFGELESTIINYANTCLHLFMLLCVSSAIGIFYGL